MTVDSGYYRHGLRPMRGRSTAEHHRAASPLELLFDLTFVAAFGVAGAQLAHGIAIGHWLPALGAFALAMVAVIWAWINYTWFASAFDTDDWLFRVLTMVQMAGVIVVAIGIPGMFASIEHGEEFANGAMIGGYVVMRVAMIAQWLRASRDPQYGLAARTYALFVGVAQVAWVVIAIVPMTLGVSLICAAVVFGVEFLGPIVAERKGERHGGGATPWHAHHIAERYQLLAIIALGETVLGTLAAAQAVSDVQGWTFDAVVVIAAGVAMTFGLWWTYFMLPSAPVLETHRERAFPWGYGHAAVFAAIAAVGAGLHVIGYVYDEHYHVTVLTAILAIAIPVLVYNLALYLLHVWLIRQWSQNGPVQLTAMLAPVLAIVIAATGGPLWLCLLIVLASPVAVVVSYEVGAYRVLAAQVDAAVGDS